ncbi:1-(5-phosphoribosyl)-5-[(5-phosphoribosylamino)methylideneamino]imidazole-4-carboxamide isomerase [Adhaeretor mobilis]|uniref:1-(5-phosphoribosyl)-5-[(5-phosphoribosylamino)methylideneamino] imidazole-4-carboxamide isomerase n=1 Tax=Adhaeretor mobilis TaxID=1930276 RepID=A0A517MZ01_9BACT|nr:1-(5-phosphoribosyl)-5-[(5-phosphoribosylamino)methylideneamino]imidazole-4-carboxamide isomerase [Adhaeretor mobilis]QDT00113.1 1-(5-phosphoribosyl)-5-[(5-phosphoribosylamino)methylideneamino] imidazole-4-carboxamide isomerase [Adhaeretor mobilis]
MEIWPAIDLIAGRCVRLQQGDYERETVFSDNPAAMARSFQDLGAKYLHLVDLDGAKAGKPCNTEVIREIVSAVDMQCEVGGGVRDEAAIETLLDVGLTRVVLGTAALKQADWFRQMCEKYPNKLALGIDAKDGWVATEGWLEVSQTNAVEMAKQFANVPLAAIIYTDIATDGMLQGPNVAAMAEMQQAVDVPVVASGGVTTVDDVTALSEAGLAAAIIGRALYEDTITLPAALAAAQ